MTTSCITPLLTKRLCDTRLPEHEPEGSATPAQQHMTPTDQDRSIICAVQDLCMGSSIWT